MFSRKVNVTFIDDATGKTFGVTKMPPADLPDSFEIDTTLHICEENWKVVNAEPKTRSEYSKSKTLTLRLRRIEKMAPDSILYSLPSICDGIPSIGDHSITGSEFEIYEDDWRQFEFISNEFASEVDEEIEKILLIHKNASAEGCWREIHVRTKPEIPLVSSPAIADLTSALNVSNESSGLTYHGAQSRIPDGYYLSTKDGLSVYGLAPNSNVQVIAFGQYSNSSPNLDTVSRLKSFARKFNLDLVYWCRCVRIAYNDPLFNSLLSDVEI